MVSTFLVLWEICLFKSGPEQVVRRKELIGIFAFLLLLLSYLTTLMVASPTIRAFFSLGVLASSIILTGVLVYVVLYFFKRSDRFIQTYSSMLGTELIINLIAFVLVLIGANLIPDDPIIQGLANVEDLDTVQFRLTPLVIAVLGLQVWLLTIRARILARACEISMLKSFLIVIGVMIAVAMLISIFQGTP